ncbi:hypothetical protein Hypma_007107 [Hypsizygus marmoreus]|uniref:Uncharacterized protein n=1 Tax=Hypsizygus marmoreus TaxID=39966 RepID=A0A369K766_HYPMA|nr:hypothetical protein Hypma_007107 [Hypsizygus marmoreus]
MLGTFLNGLMIAGIMKEGRFGYAVSALIPGTNDGHDPPHIIELLNAAWFAGAQALISLAFSFVFSLFCPVFPIPLWRLFRSPAVFPLFLLCTITKYVRNLRHSSLCIAPRVKAYAGVAATLVGSLGNVAVYRSGKRWRGCPVHSRRRRFVRSGSNRSIYAQVIALIQKGRYKGESWKLGRSSRRNWDATSHTHPHASFPSPHWRSQSSAVSTSSLSPVVLTPTSRRTHLPFSQSARHPLRNVTRSPLILTSPLYHVNNVSDPDHGHRVEVGGSVTLYSVRKTRTGGCTRLSMGVMYSSTRS